MTATITISWNSDRLEATKVTFSDGFKSLTPIERADCLLDAKFDLDKAYDAVLTVMQTRAVSQ